MLDAISATRRSARRAGRREARVATDRAMMALGRMVHGGKFRVTTVRVPVVPVTPIPARIAPVGVAPLTTAPVTTFPVTTARVSTARATPARATTANVPMVPHRRDRAATGSRFKPVRDRTTMPAETPPPTAMSARSKLLARKTPPGARSGCMACTQSPPPSPTLHAACAALC